MSPAQAPARHRARRGAARRLEPLGPRRRARSSRRTRRDLDGEGPSAGAFATTSSSASRWAASSCRRCDGAGGDVEVLARRLLATRAPPGRPLAVGLRSSDLEARPPGPATSASSRTRATVMRRAKSTPVGASISGARGFEIRPHRARAVDGPASSRERGARSRDRGDSSDGTSRPLSIGTTATSTRGTAWRPLQDLALTAESQSRRPGSGRDARRRAARRAPTRQRASNFSVSNETR